MLGHNNPKILWLKGKVYNKDVTILIDGRSTHNFFQDRVSKFFGISTSSSRSFQVIIGNRDHLYCNTVCHQVPVIVGSNTFRTDFAFRLWVARK